MQSFTALNTRVNTAILIVIALTCVMIVTMLAKRAYGGPLDPPGAPSPTQPNLIFQPATCAGFPIVLSSPGSYRLTSNITGCAAKDGINITTSDVSIDLAGFTLAGVPGSFNGLRSIGSVSQLRIENGAVVTWGDDGVDLFGSSNARIDGVIATYNGIVGIHMGGSSVLSQVTSSFNGVQGVVIAATGTNGTISDCNVDHNLGRGIEGLDGVTVENCSIGNNSGDGINLGAFAKISNNHVHHNTGNGVVSNHSCAIEHNSSEWNGSAGFFVYAPGNCTIVGNKSTANGTNGFVLDVNGGYTRVDGNHASGNVQFGFFIGVANPGYPNIVTRNAASANALGNYAAGANNDVAPTATAGSATDPMSNISN